MSALFQGILVYVDIENSSATVFGRGNQNVMEKKYLFCPCYI